MDETAIKRLDNLTGQVAAFQLLIPVALLGAVRENRTRKNLISTLKTIESEVTENFQKDLPNVVEGQVAVLRKVREVLEHASKTNDNA